jgi:hypothetical protein
MLQFRIQYSCFEQLFSGYIYFALYLNNVYNLSNADTIEKPRIKCVIFAITQYFCHYCYAVYCLF